MNLSICKERGAVDLKYFREELDWEKVKLNETYGLVQHNSTVAQFKKNGKVVR